MILNFNCPNCGEQVHRNPSGGLYVYYGGVMMQRHDVESIECPGVVA